MHCSVMNHNFGFILLLQVNIWKIIYMTCGEIYEDMIDYRSYVQILTNYEII